MTDNGPKHPDESASEILGRDLIWRLGDIAFVVLIGVGFTILWMLVLRFLAGVFVWIAMALSTVGTVTITATLWARRSHPLSFTTVNLIGGNEDDVTISTLLLEYWLFVFLTVLMTTVVVVNIAIIRKAQTVVPLFTEANRAFADMPALFAQPFITATTILIFSVLWLLGLICILAVAHPQLNPDDKQTVRYQTDDFFMVMCPFYVLFFFWLIQIVVNCQSFIVASTVSSWYFARHKTQMDSPVLQSFQALLAYHLGSITYGSLLLLAMVIPRAVITAAHLIVARRTRIFPAFEKCWASCCGCLDRFFMYIGRNAIIVMAIHGFSFRTSGKRAQKLISRHRGQLAAVDSVADFVLFLAKLMAALLATFCGVWFIKTMYERTIMTVYVWVPLLMGGIISYHVADSCISVYEIAIDTLFLCFCEESERNSEESKPSFASEVLQGFMEESKKRLDTSIVPQPLR